MKYFSGRPILSYRQECNYCRNTLKYHDIILGPYRPPLAGSVQCIFVEESCLLESSESEQKHQNCRQ